MPTLHNPAAHRLACYRIGRILDADERVEITDEEAADLVNGAVFVVEDYGDAPEADGEPAADADESTNETAEDGDDDSDSDEESGDTEPKATPKRTTARRGSKRAEVTEAPDVEKRG